MYKIFRVQSEYDMQQSQIAPRRRITDNRYTTKSQISD